MKFRSFIKALLMFVACFVFVSTMDLRAGTTNYVFLRHTAYDPSSLTISVGDTVIFSSQQDGHTVTGSGNDPFCGNRTLFSGDSCTNTFNTAGTFNYYCIYHAIYGMTGTIIVQQTTNQVQPSITITNPANNSTFAAPTLFVLGVGFTNVTATVQSVQYFQNNTAIATVTNAPYSINVSNLSSGTFTYQAQASTSGGALLSPSITVNLVDPVGITNSNPQVVNSSFQFSFTANAGLQYALESSTNLIDWISLNTNTATSNPFSVMDTNSSNFTFLFYRVRRVQ